MSATLKPKTKPAAPRGAKKGPVESEAAKFRRANEMLDKLLVETKALSIRAGETLARLQKS